MKAPQYIGKERYIAIFLSVEINEKEQIECGTSRPGDKKRKWIKDIK